MIVTVKAGDTLSRIAAQYGVSVAAIASANKIGNVNQIRVGQVLTIPGATIPGNAAALQNTAGPVVVGVLPVAAPIPGTPGWLQNILNSVPAIAQANEASKTANALNRANLDRARAGLPAAESLTAAAAAVTQQQRPEVPRWLLIGGAAAIGLVMLFSSKPSPQRSTRKS
ncbi:LysM peptidoglycan-binding domain-containing protein [Nevskia ramosa]|uniref:LysM peptidoglycan-binding domain-containing protein n=1 Tax=Nevskia ramosa TaxID=64002 RepID=UPI0003B74943|nr:LysM domain-containing protein [Nevskia ramosa]